MIKETYKYRDPEELFNDWGHCKICDFQINKPTLGVNVHEFNHFDVLNKIYRREIEYHFELHLKDKSNKMINRDVG